MNLFMAALPASHFDLVLIFKLKVLTMWLVGGVDEATIGSITIIDATGWPPFASAENLVTIIAKKRKFTPTIR